MPPASFVHPGVSRGDVWTLSIATERLITSALLFLLRLLLTLVADAWPAPFVGFLRTYEHLGLLSGQVIISIRLEQRQLGFLFHARGFFLQARTSLMSAYIWAISSLFSAIVFSL